MPKRILKAVRHPISRNVIALYWLQIAQFIVPLVTLPYVARVLEPSAFGLVVFSQGLTFLLILVIDWGLAYTGTRSVAENQDKPEALARIVQRVRGAQLLLAAASLPFTLAAMVLVPKLAQHPEFVAMAWVAAVASALVPGWFFVGTERPQVIGLIQLGIRAAGAALTFVLVEDPGHAWIVMALFSGFSVAGWAVGDVLLYRRVEFRRPRWRSSVAEIRRATTLFVGMVGAALYGAFNVVLLGLLEANADVAHFGAAERVVRVSLTLLGPIGLAVLPRLIALQAAGRRERARTLLITTVAAAAVPALMLTAAFSLLAPTIIGIIYGQGFVDASVPILRVLAWMIPVSLTGVAFGAWLITQHRDRVSALIVLIAGLVNVVLGCALTLSFGPIGMAWSVLAAEATAAVGAFLAVTRGNRRRPVPVPPGSPQPQMVVPAERHR